MFALLLGSVTCDVAGQVCFKLGVSDGKAPTRSGVSGFVLGLVRSPWIALGVVVYALEFLFWFGALSIAPLSLAPLSVAFPFAALSYCGVVVASRFVLHERVSHQRWFGTLAIAGGVALVCWP